LKAAAAKATDSPEIQYHYAAALAESGQRAEALAVLKPALKGHLHFVSRADAETLLAQLSR
jgi:hypothetical protein